MGIEASVLTAIASAVGAGASLIGALDKGGGAPSTPALEKPIPMPDPEAQARARRRSIAQQLGRRGRASTVLTTGADSGTDALGGG